MSSRRLRPMLLHEDPDTRAAGLEILITLYPMFAGCKEHYFRDGYHNAAHDQMEIHEPPMLAGQQQWCPEHSWALYIRGYASFWRVEGYELLPGELSIPEID